MLLRGFSTNTQVWAALVLKKIFCRTFGGQLGGKGDENVVFRPEEIPVSGRNFDMDLNAAQHRQATRSNWSLGLFDLAGPLLGDLNSGLRALFTRSTLTHFNVAIHAVAREGEGARHRKSASVGGNRLKFERITPGAGLGRTRFESGPRPPR